MTFTTTDAFWHTPYHCVYEDAAIRLLQFSAGQGVPVLVVPPQAGHHSYIADYGEDQSLVQSAIDHTDAAVYAIEWKSCTFERRREGIEDLLGQLDVAVTKVGSPVHLVGLCQGGWLSTIYTALYPDQVISLVIAGTPIDTQVGKSVLHDLVAMPLPVFQCLVASGGGVMSGQLMLSGWKSANPLQHYVLRHLDRSEKSEKLYRWYDYTQDLPGTLYLWIIENLFKRNRLGRNELEIAGQPVDLTAIRCPVIVVSGKTDDITPVEQSLGLLKYAQGPSRVFSIDAGHIGVFMSRKGIRDVWSQIFQQVPMVA